MSENKHDPSDPFQPQGEVTPPEAYRPPEVHPQPEAYTAPEAYLPPPSYAHPPEPPHAYHTTESFTTEPFHGVPPAIDSLGGPEPLVAAEPLPPMAGATPAAPDTRLAIETGGLRLDRIVEEVVAWLKTLASAAVYATLIVTFGFQVARVEGQSMAPTLADQDRLIVNKLAYRIGEPQVGDIVMLYYPLRPEKSFVKRVIAAEGDQVRIVDGKIYRNDVLMDDSFVPPEFRSHDDWGPRVIDEGYYFVMGDHRNNSSDSRHWGLVPKKYIIGRVQLRWWPVPNAKIF
jgi:signal peptidase I